MTEPSDSAAADPATIDVVSTEPTLEQEMVDWLSAIDAHLAKAGVSLPERPLRASLLFVENAVTMLSTGEEAFPPPTGSDLVTQPWFRIVFHHAKAWYAKRYGDRMKASGGQLSAVALVFGTPVLLKVPTTVSTPEQPGKTAWFQMPDRLLDGEDPMGWLQAGPALDTGDQADAKRACKLVVEVAGALRAINGHRLGVAHDDPVKIDLLSGVLPGLERAAELLVAGGRQNLKQVHWELQMSVERALKALSQDRTGGFVETHDLFKLYDALVPLGIDVKRGQLKKLPNWQVMADLRYGGGPERSVEETFEAYRAVLRLVRAAFLGLKAAKVGQARFLLQMPPWMRSYDEP